MPRNDTRLICFGDNIKTFREKLELTQVELADKCGFSPSYLKLVEAGKSNITFMRLIKLSLALEIELQNLVVDL